MSLKVFNAYKFSDEFSIEAYNDAVKFLNKMKKDYYNDLLNNFFTYYPLEELDKKESVRDKVEFLSNIIEEDIKSSFIGAYLSIDLEVSIVCWDNSIVFVFYPNNRHISDFIEKKMEGYKNWSYTNQTDDDFDDETFEDRSDFWETFFDENYGPWCDVTLGYTIFGLSDVKVLAFDVCYKNFSSKV